VQYFEEVSQGIPSETQFIDIMKKEWNVYEDLSVFSTREEEI
jgi:hypothetical protein